MAKMAIRLLIINGSVIILIIDNGYFKNLIYIFIVLIIIFVVSLLGFKAYSAWKLNNVINMQQESKERIIKTFLANKDIFDDLVKNMYSNQEDMEIEFSNGNIQLYVNGKKEKLDKEFYSLLNKLYSVMKCESVTLNKDSLGNRILTIFLGNSHLDNKNIYAESILYCKDKVEGVTDEFFPGWHYKILWYT